MKNLWLDVEISSSTACIAIYKDTEVSNCGVRSIREGVRLGCTGVVIEVLYGFIALSSEVSPYLALKGRCR